eukprot:1194462-Prymnesium_polylepis.1
MSGFGPVRAVRVVGCSPLCRRTALSHARGMFRYDSARAGSNEDRGASVIARLHKVGMRRVKALDVRRRPVRVRCDVGCSRRWRRTELSHATGVVWA